jgi:hypothetical protein
MWLQRHLMIQAAPDAETISLRVVVDKSPLKTELRPFAMSGEPKDGDRAEPRNRFNWWLPLYAAIGTFVVCFAVAIWTSEVFFYVLLVVPLISLILGGSSVIAAIAKKRHGSLALLSMLVSYWAISAVLVTNYSAIRAPARWLIWSHEYKSEVLAQATPSNGELKHIAWDGWGFPGAGDTTVYLVFDPTDALSAAAQSHRPGKFGGLPCEVPLVRRLESHWYAVLFYTDEWWGQDALDCGSGPQVNGWNIAWPRVPTTPSNSAMADLGKPKTGYLQFLERFSTVSLTVGLSGGQSAKRTLWGDRYEGMHFDVCGNNITRFFGMRREFDRHVFPTRLRPHHSERMDLGCWLEPGQSVWSVRDAGRLQPATPLEGETAELVGPIILEISGCLVG